MNISPSKPFQIVYSFYQHEFFGYLVDSFLVQQNSEGRLTLQYQNISAKNASDFKEGLDETDFKLIKLTEELHSEFIAKKFSIKKQSSSDFFKKIFDKNKPDAAMQDLIFQYIGKTKTSILALLQGKEIYEMSSDGNPAHKKIEFLEEKAKVVFNFERDAEGIKYFPTVICNQKTVDLINKNAFILNNIPGFLVVDGKLYALEQGIDAQKIKPFLDQPYIFIPKKLEDSYFRKFVFNLLLNQDILAKGFTINQQKDKFKFEIGVNLIQNTGKKLHLFEETTENSSFSHVVLDLKVHYGAYSFPYSIENPIIVSLNKVLDDYVFTKVVRNMEAERKLIQKLKELGFLFTNSKINMPFYEGISILSEKKEELEQLGVVVHQHDVKEKKYYIGKQEILLKVKEQNDWFDLKAIIRFGQFEFSFLAIRQYILNRTKEFPLPDGSIAILPDAWFTDYADLFELSTQDDQENFRLARHHAGLILEMEQAKLIETQFDDKLRSIATFNAIEEVSLPIELRAELRPYQKSGFDWLCFLNQYNFGGCLADDMGLGKTLQTIAVLLKSKSEKKSVSLLVVPTSLVFNWVIEIKKFAPGYKYFIYSGYNREKNTNYFEYYDLIITTYGVLRTDINLFSNYNFEYVILDEAQAIKNPGSLTNQVVNKLNSRLKLAITGTPIENSTMDLWSIMDFINPGLLGNKGLFQENYSNTIEKQRDIVRLERLKQRIKPFILRRTKTQVAKDLPEKIEQIQYCQMSEAQHEMYEKTKASIRNAVIEDLEKHGYLKNHIMMLQGLTKLRQISSHPAMIDTAYKDGSGKLDDVLEKLINIVQEGHKVLVFSSFVKHLAIIEKELKDFKIQYSYLDGNVKDRQTEVQNFQNDEKNQVFLISLKAGGVGLNLTAAEYVFILEPWWNPAVENQAISRAHRIGQKNTVFIYKFITQDTVEEKILNLQIMKSNLATELIDQDEALVNSLTKEDILEILG